MRSGTITPRSITLCAIAAPAAMFLAQLPECPMIGPQSPGGITGECSGTAASCCLVDPDCDDARFCNGPEVCIGGGICSNGVPPCGEGEMCNETANRCDQCTLSADCDDGKVCTEDVCVDGQCRSFEIACEPGHLCEDGRCVDLCDSTLCDDDDPCTRDDCQFGFCIIRAVACAFPFQCDGATGECAIIGKPCVSQCYLGDGSCGIGECTLGTGACPPRALDEFENFETLLAAWRESPLCGLPEPGVTWMIAGECADGTQFLYRDDFFNLFLVVHFFDPSTGAFIALKNGVDALDEQCNGLGYWPYNHPCSEAIVTEVICGDDFKIGDMFSLP